MEIFQLEDEVHYEKLNENSFILPSKFGVKNNCKLVPVCVTIRPIISQAIPKRQRRSQIFELRCDSCSKPLISFREGSYEQALVDIEMYDFQSISSTNLTYKTKIYLPKDKNLFFECSIPANRKLKFSISPKIKYNLCRKYKVKINLMVISDDSIASDFVQLPAYKYLYL
jgi:hypothetical protein